MGPVFAFHLIAFGYNRFNDMSTLAGHFLSSSREKKKRDRRDSRDVERWIGAKEENECK